MTSRLLLSTMFALGSTAACSDVESRAVEPPSSADTVAATAVAPASLTGFSLYDLGSSWIDQRGDSLAFAHLNGKVRVIAMVYTSCHTTCPVIVNEMKRIESRLPAAGREHVGFVLVSFDQARDMPGRLATWADDNHLDQARWTLLSGSDAAVRELGATLGVRYQSLPDGEIAHSNVLTVVDAAGVVVHQQMVLGDETLATSAVVNRLLSRGD